MQEFIRNPLDALGNDSILSSPQDCSSSLCENINTVTRGSHSLVTLL